jgi:transcriptional regulator with XRE-family HTH domain
MIYSDKHILSREVSMPKLKIQELARARGFNISQLQLKAGVAMGTMRRYWYGTRDGKTEGTPLQEVDLAILASIAQALEVKLADLIDEAERLAWLLAVGQHNTSSQAEGEAHRPAATGRMASERIIP